MLTWVEIDTAKLQSNIDAFRSIAPNAAIMAVVKANAYGHGLDVVAPAAADRADWLGVNTFGEALAVRSLGIQKPIAILGHTEPEYAAAIVREGFRQVIYRLDVAEALSAAAMRSHCDARIHIKIETGTHRQGISQNDLPGFIENIRRMGHLNVEGVYTHFANIEDTLDPSFAQLQIQRFNESLAVLEQIGIRPPCIHAAATAGALLYPETEFTMIRVGIGAYGVWPSRETQIAARERGRKISLAPVLTWKTRVAQVKTLDPGDYVGYGLTYQATRRMRIAVLPIGYYDGYDRRLSNCGRVLVKGRPASVVGRIAMNMTMVDVTEVDATLDDEVVLLGRQGDSEIRAEELAEKIGTIAYEFLARISPVIPRLSASSHRS